MKNLGKIALVLLLICLLLAGCGSTDAETVTDAEAVTDTSTDTTTANATTEVDEDPAICTIWTSTGEYRSFLTSADTSTEAYSQTVTFFAPLDEESGEYPTIVVRLTCPKCDVSYEWNGSTESFETDLLSCGGGNVWPFGHTSRKVYIVVGPGDYFFGIGNEEASSPIVD